MQKGKKILLFVIIAVLLVVVAWFGYYLLHYVFYNEYKDDLSSYEYEEGTEFTPIKENVSDVEGMVLAAQNDFLKLYVDKKTANIAVVDKRNGQITYSNPVLADEDAIASNTNKNYLKSQLLLDYFNLSRTEGTLDSYSYCTSLENQLEIESISSGVRFIYTIGDLTSATGIVPQYISQAKLDEICSLLPEDEGKFIRKKFVESDVAEGYLEMLEATMNGKSQLRKLNTYFEEAGFTQEDYNIEMAGSGADDAIPVSFVVPLEYRLDNESLEVSIPADHIVENGGGYIYKIQLLRFFGAAHNDEDGYILVPNGSGSIIYFNNGKSTADNYSEYVYGIDPLAAEYTVKENTVNAKMSLFGIFRNRSAIFATIEDGAANSLVSASVSGKYNEYNNVYPTFVMRGSERLAMFGTTGNEADLPVIETNFYDMNMTVRYSMLNGEEASYSGAANYYRNRLIREGVLTPLDKNDKNIPLFYDLICGAGETKFFLGSQYDGLADMTTFEEAESIVKDLALNGVSSQNVNVQGWMNGGYYHDAVRKISVPWSLGGKTGLEDLSKTVEANGGSLFVDVAFQKVSEADDSYPVSNETARYYASGYVAEFGLVNPATLRQTSGLGYDANRFYLVSPKFLVRYVDKFNRKIDKYNVTGVSLRDLGSEIHSDKKRTNVIDREAALDVVEGCLGRIEETTSKVMVNGANDYAFKYADAISNAPLTDNNYYIVDETIPFYEMLIHGCIEYSGDVINLNDSGNRDDIVLELIENGASPHFVFTKKNASEIKNTALNNFYATTYDNWKIDALTIYNRVNSVLSEVSDAYIIRHEILESGVTLIKYSNGKIIYVNKTDYPVYVDGMTVPEHGCVLGGDK